MRFHISTDSVAEHEQFDYWSDRMFEVMGTTALANPQRGRRFRARLTAMSRGPLLYVDYNGDGRPIARQNRNISHKFFNGYWLYREDASASWFRHAGHEFVTRAGDLLIADADVPFDAVPQARYAHKAWLVPKSLLDPHLPALGRPLSVPLSGRSGVDALAASYLDSIARTWDGIDEASMGVVTDTLCRLVGVACGGAEGAHPTAVRHGRLAEAKRIIDRHLADPNLSPALVAAKLGVGVRTLHGLFEPEGTSFTRYVQHRRLEECRAALMASPTRAVTDIAYAWGFGSLSSFYRAFHAAFGAAPGDCRAAPYTA